MPFNACSINTDSVDSLCSIKRTKYIEILFGGPIDPPVVEKKGKPGFTGYYPNFDTDNEEKVDPSTLEHLYITLVVTLAGEDRVVSHFDNSPGFQRPFVYVNKLRTSDSTIRVTIKEKQE